MSTKETEVLVHRIEWRRSQPDHCQAVFRVNHAPWIKPHHISHIPAPDHIKKLADETQSCLEGHTVIHEDSSVEVEHRLDFLDGSLEPSGRFVWHAITNYYVDGEFSHPGDRFEVFLPEEFYQQHDSHVDSLCGSVKISLDMRHEDVQFHDFDKSSAFNHERYNRLVGEQNAAST